MSKQTAVQWLHYHLLHLMQTKEWRSKDLHIEKFDELFIEALTMEREQMAVAFCEGSKLLECPNELSATFEFALYYIETYGGDK